MHKKYFCLTKLSAFAMGKSNGFISPFSILNEKNIDNIFKRNSQDFVIKSKDDLISASDYVQTKHKKYLELISQKLNEIHNTDFSLEFWKRAFSQGLLRQITFIHQTFTILEDTFDPYKCHFKTLSKKCFKIFDNFEDQRNHLVGHIVGKNSFFHYM